MEDNLANLKKLLGKLRELNSLDVISEKVKNKMGNLHDKKMALLKQIESTFVHYNNLRNLQQEESEERKLLQELERVVVRQESFVNFLAKLLTKFDDDTGKIIGLLHNEYFIYMRHYNPSTIPTDPTQQFGRAIYNFFAHLHDAIYYTRERIRQEQNFIKKWLAGTGFLSFVRKKSVLTNFQKELTGLYELYRQSEEYVRSKIEEIPALQKDIRDKAIAYIARVREKRIYSKSPKAQRKYSSVVSSLAEESDTFGKELAMSFAIGLFGPRRDK